MPLSRVPGVALVQSPLDLFGGQLKFPTTQNPSSDANTLDDYEEGTWTPVIDSATPGTGRVTTVNSATYVKIGRVCYVNMYLTLSTLGTGGSGGIVVNGFPFPSQGYSGLAMVYFDQFNSTLSSVGLTTDPSATTSQLRAVATATASTILPSFATYAKANLNFIVTGFYQTTA